MVKIKIFGNLTGRWNFCEFLKRILSCQGEMESEKFRKRSSRYGRKNYKTLVKHFLK
jgi:hypothetical protein